MAGVGRILGEAFHKKFNEDYLLKCIDIDVNEYYPEYLDGKL